MVHYLTHMSLTPYHSLTHTPTLPHQIFEQSYQTSQQHKFTVPYIALYIVQFSAYSQSYNIEYKLYFYLTV